MELTDGKIDLYSGNDDQIVPLLSLGGIGVISVLSNIAPKETHDIVMKYLEGDVAGSRDLQIRAISLIDELFCEVNPIPVKAAMNLMGKEVGPLRLPLTEMEPANQARLAAAMRDFGLNVVTDMSADADIIMNERNDMVKIIMHGCNGHMGQVISGLVKEDEGAEIVAGIDVVDNRDNGYPVFTDMNECEIEADAIIDFSTAKAADAILDYSVRRQIPIVLCTTGLSEEQLQKVEETAKKLRFSNLRICHWALTCC